MPRLKAGTLGAFARIFPGLGDETQTPTELDAAAPIQPVADVSRIAQHGYEVFGSLATSHAGAGTTRDDVKATEILALGTPPLRAAEVDLWITALSLQIDGATSGNWTSASAGYVGSNAPPLAESTQWARPLGVWSSVGTDAIIATQQPQASSPVIARPDGFSGAVLPVLMRPDNAAAGLYLVSVATAAVTSVRLLWTIRIVPRGASPPGLS